VVPGDLIHTGKRAPGRTWRLAAEADDPPPDPEQPANVTKRVALGEFPTPPRNCGGVLVYRAGSRQAGRQDHPKPRRRGSLRPAGWETGALRFEAGIPRSERNRGGRSRRPRPALSSSRALWLTPPANLTAGLLSGRYSPPFRSRTTAQPTWAWPRPSPSSNVSSRRAFCPFAFVTCV
jgi:hypothetical protein